MESRGPNRPGGNQGIPCAAQVGTSKGDARDIFQHLSGAAVQMGAAHRAVAEGSFRPFDLGAIGVIEDDLFWEALFKIIKGRAAREKL